MEILKQNPLQKQSTGRFYKTSLWSAKSSRSSTSCSQILEFGLKWHVVTNKLTKLGRMLKTVLNHSELFRIAKTCY